MFFSGSLQEGIGKAIQEQKRVVCFVRNDTEESSEWARDYLQPLAEIMKDHAVVLELQHGSAEANYLAAIAPVDAAPLVVVIYNGQVRGALKPPMSVTEFRKQILTAMDLNFRISNPAEQAAASSQPAEAATAPPAQPAQPVSSTASSQASSDSAATGRRQAAHTAAHEERQTKAATESPKQTAEESDSKAAYQAKLVEEKKKQRQTAADEKKRVLDLIEKDKQERRNQAAQRAAEREAQRQKIEETVHTEPVASASKAKSRAGGASATCRLQLRLWDGRTERAEFQAQQTIADVQKWLDTNIEPKAGPFSLREVIGVGAARPLDVANEKKTLSALGLTPSATLIVKPFTNVTGQYEEPSFRRTLFNVFFGPFIIIRAFVLALWFTLLGFITGQPQNAVPPGRETPTASEPTGRASGVQTSRSKVQTLEDRDKKKDKPTLYNGNQLGVLPNPKDEDNAE